MKRSSYREQDYAFGQLMLTLRARIGLTQAGLADLLGVSRRAVAEWEGGLAYPKADHLKAFLALCVRQQAFPAGREAEEIRALWHAAHQNVLLDELWLQGLLAKPLSPQVTAPVAQARGAEVVSTPLAGRGSRVDWGDAPDVPSFYGREREMATLAKWVVQERCRVVSVLGLGGIGKSALAVSLMRQVAPHFEIVLWRSLRDAPSCEALLEDCLQVLAPEVLRDVPVSLERRFSLLLECVRRTRVLLVLDNLETLLEEGQSTGHLRPGYEGYARLLRQMAETEHQSCLLLTSREKPAGLVPLEGNREPVRALRLARLDADACQQPLADKQVAGSAADQARLIEAYAGNPLALNIIAQTIVDLFDGEIAPFLEQGEVVFGGVRALLDEQYARLANLEQMVLHWLAIVREPVNLGKLRALLVMPGPSGELLEAVDRLRQRSLIEHGQHPGSFTLQALVLEYVTMRLGGERRDHAGTACASDPAWALPGSRQGVWTADLGAAAGSRAGMFSAYPPEVRSGGRAVTLAARPSA
jgi:transcriptional regulator with XRE-family HTH domain